MASPAQLERLSTALDADTRAGLAMDRNQTFENVTAGIRAQNVLFDTCIDAGMSLETIDFRTWAAVRVARWLRAA